MCRKSREKNFTGFSQTQRFPVFVRNNSYYYSLIGETEKDTRVLPLIRFCGNPLTDGLLLRLVAMCFLFCLQIPISRFIIFGYYKRRDIYWVILPLPVIFLFFLAFSCCKHLWLKKMAQRDCWKKTIPTTGIQKGKPKYKDLLRFSTQGKGFVVLPDQTENCYSIASISPTEEWVFKFLDFFVLGPLWVIVVWCFFVFNTGVALLYYFIGGLFYLLLYELIKRFFLFSPWKKWLKVSAQSSDDVLCDTES